MTILIHALLSFTTQNICHGNAKEIYRKNRNSTVVVNCFDKKEEIVKIGSGFIVTIDGQIVTNYHVINGANKISAVVQGKQFSVEKLIYIDKNNDLAILKIDGRNFSPVRIGNSEKLEVGSQIYVIGSPMGLENSISEGIISALRIIGSQKIIQITAPISTGSSGGPVFNENGEVIAVATSYLKESQNVNFAIPIDVISQKLITNKSDYTGISPKEDYFSTSEYWLNRCRGFSAAQLWEDGLNACDRALEMNPNLAEAYLLNAISLFYLSEFNKTIGNCAKVILLTEDVELLAGAHTFRALSHFVLGHFQQAISDSTYGLKLIEEKVENAELAYSALMARGGSYLALGMVNTSISDFDTIIKNYSGNIPKKLLSATYQYRGHAYFRSGRYREAVEDYKKNTFLAIEKQPDVYRSLGFSYIYLGEKELAVKNLTIAAKLGDQDAQKLLLSVDLSW